MVWTRPRPPVRQQQSTCLIQAEAGRNSLPRTCPEVIRQMLRCSPFLQSAYHLLSEGHPLLKCFNSTTCHLGPCKIVTPKGLLANSSFQTSYGKPLPEKKKARLWAGTFFRSFLIVAGRATNTPTSKNKMLVCYVAATELSTGRGLDNFSGWEKLTCCKWLLR